jgi:peroxiredoxin
MTLKKINQSIFCLILSWLVVGLAGRWLSGQQAVNQSPARGTARIYQSLEEATRNSSQPVLLVFFSLACYVCWDELFEMKEFIEKFSLPVLLVGVSTDGKEELQAFADRYSFPYPIVQDEEKQLYRRYRVRLEPYRLILVKNQPVYQDDDLLDYSSRREKAKNFLFRLASL